MHESIFKSLVEQITTDPVAARSARPGLCRVWTAEAIRVAKNFRHQNQVAFRLEAREKELEPFFWHTFLRLCLENTLYICDGPGTAAYPPFFGLESQAPHLQNSSIDPIQYYDLDDEPMS